MTPDVLHQALGSLLVTFLVGLASGAWLCVMQLTDFLSEYISVCNKLVRIDKKFDTRDDLFNELAQKAVDKDSMALEFLYKLLMCPVCLGTWFCLIFCLLSGISGAWFWITWFSSLSVAVFVRYLLAKLGK